MDAGTKERVAEYVQELVQGEEAIGEFYRACAEAWPADRDFWEQLADEETVHAVRLELVLGRIRRSPHGVGLLRPYPPATIQAFVRAVGKDTELVRAGLLSPEAAFVRARDLEQSLIASQPLRGLSFDDPRFPRYWQEITAQIATHARHVMDRVARIAAVPAAPAPGGRVPQAGAA